MSYVDALFDRDTDKISVVERIEGERRYVEYPARYVAYYDCLLYTSPSPRDALTSRMPSSA